MQMIEVCLKQTQITFAVLPGVFSRTSSDLMPAVHCSEWSDIQHGVPSVAQWSNSVTSIFSRFILTNHHSSGLCRQPVWTWSGLQTSNLKQLNTSAHDPWNSSSLGLISVSALAFSLQKQNMVMLDCHFLTTACWYGWLFFWRLKRLHAHIFQNQLNPLGITIMIQVAFRRNHEINIMPNRKRGAASMEEDMAVMLPELWLGQISVTGSWNLWRCVWNVEKIIE